MPKLGFLLGAGASYPFGIPMMREFYNGFFEYIRINRAHCMPLLEKIAGGSATTPDLEFLIQRLEQVRAGRQALKILGKKIEGEDGDLTHADELRGYLDMYLIETCEKFKEIKVKEKLSIFAKLVHSRNAYVFTTNYDRLIEVAAADSALEYSDGFEPISTRPESKWNGNFSSGIRLIKLHGSVNWYKEEETQSLFRLERGYSLPSHEYGLTHGDRTLRPLMIIPTLEKSILTDPYVGLLMQFSDALKELDILVIIGNSLRDDHLRNTIIQRMGSLEVIIINPAARDQTNIVGRQEATHAVPLGIEEFIDFGLDPFDRMLSDLVQLPTVDERRQRIVALVTDLASTSELVQDLSAEEREQLQALKNGTDQTKLKILKSLCQPVHTALVAEVREQALGVGGESVRVAAIDAFVDLRGTDAIEVLIEIACAPCSLPVRAEALLALKSFGGGAAVEALKYIANAVAGDKQMESFFATIV